MKYNNINSFVFVRLQVKYKHSKSTVKSNESTDKYKAVIWQKYRKFFKSLNGKEYRKVFKSSRKNGKRVQ